MKNYLRLLKYLHPYKLPFSFAAVCMVIFAISNGALAYLIGPAMKVLFSPGPGEAVRVVPFDIITVPRESLTLIVPLALIVMAVIKGFSFYGNTYYMGYVGQMVVCDLRRTLYEHILRLPVKYFSSSSTGNLASRLTNDASMLQRTTADALAIALRQGLTIAVLAAVIIGMDPELALVALVVFPLAIWPMIKLGSKMKRASRKGQVTMGAMTSLLHEAISGVRIVKAFGMEGYETDRFSSENKRFTGYRLKTIRVKGISTPLMETLGAVGFAATIWYASYRINAGTLKPEDFISFFAALVMLYQPIKALNGVHLNIQQGLAAAQRVFEVMDVEGEPASSDGIELKGFSEAVEFRDVKFSYDANVVLKDINLKVASGEMVALVGASGSGKTTLVNLLPRFYSPAEGAVLIDGIDIGSITLTSLRAHIAIVSQHVVLFNDTIKGNISYGDRTRSGEEIVEAARAANADGFIRKLPLGYDTIIGEGGMRLSGGERQRLSIARAILKDAPILIMDEATSSLDAESELEVRKGLKNLMTGRTVFVIAHRLSTVKNADRIVVLAHGTIVETGRHEDLLKRSGEYARLYEIQFQGVA